MGLGESQIGVVPRVANERFAALLPFDVERRVMPVCSAEEQLLAATRSVAVDAVEIERERPFNLRVTRFLSDGNGAAHLVGNELAEVGISWTQVGAAMPIPRHRERSRSCRTGEQ